MINKEIKREHILSAIEEIDKKGVPKNRQSKKFVLVHNNKFYPPKYTLSIASKIATNEELLPEHFEGGKETNDFLTKLGFKIKNTSSVSIKETTIKSDIKICTAVIGSKHPYYTWDNNSISTKREILDNILKNIDNTTDILVLPAGFFLDRNREPEQFINQQVDFIQTNLLERNLNLTVCSGVDSYNKSDQLAIAVSKNGLIAKARKFHHFDDNIELAYDAYAEESGKSRFFQIKEKTFYLAVCYDLFGINHKKLSKNQAPHAIIGMIHGFDKSGVGASSDFARKGMAGASKQWGVNCYSSAFFADGLNYEKWPSGIEWKHGEDSVTSKKYDDIKIKELGRENVNSTITFSLRYFNF